MPTHRSLTRVHVVVASVLLLALLSITSSGESAHVPAPAQRGARSARRG